jgi:hypothetical protein
VPGLYLKGISTNDMSDALSHLGFDGSGFSPASVVRMKPKHALTLRGSSGARMLLQKTPPYSQFRPPEIPFFLVQIKGSSILKNVSGLPDQKGFEKGIGFSKTSAAFLPRSDHASCRSQPLRFDRVPAVD